MVSRIAQHKLDLLIGGQVEEFGLLRSDQEVHDLEREGLALAVLLIVLSRGHDEHILKESLGDFAHA